MRRISTSSYSSCHTWLLIIKHGHNSKRIWKAKISLKIKIFLWLAEQNAIITKDNLFKRKWKGNSSCTFCTKMRQIITYFSNAPRPNMYGVYWLMLWALIVDQVTWINFGSGFTTFFLRPPMSMLLGWRLLSRPFGAHEMRCALIIKGSNLLQRLSI
jgi:hypothetical protein